MVLRDLFWLWGHPEGAHNNSSGNKRESRMTPAEFCSCFGVRNTFMVPIGIDVNRRQYNKSFRFLNQVGWDVFNIGEQPEKIEPIIAEAADFPNIGCVVFDDFKSDYGDGLGPRYKRIDFNNLVKIHDRLHNNSIRKLDSWMVLYTEQFGLDSKEDTEFQPYMDLFDGIIMWTAKEADVSLIPEKFEILKNFTPNTRRMFGCYLYDFSDCKQATGDAVKWQLDFYRDKIMNGEAEGVVLHTNTLADVDYEAFDVALKWMDEHGDEEV